MPFVKSGICYKFFTEKEVIKMSIKEKLINQLGVLENLQLLATSSGDFSVALRTSETILEYIRTIDMANEREGQDDPDYPDYICPDCEEAMLKEMLHQDIANACDMPIELVNRVLAGQDEVLNLE